MGTPGTLSTSIATVAALAALSGCAAPTPPEPRNPVALTYFGYAAIACDLDDPFDEEDRTDYSAEVAGFTNANQVCVTADMTVLADRLRAAAAQYTPIFAVEPVFFSWAEGHGRLHPAAEELWGQVIGAVTASGVDPEELIFYLADEPELRGLPTRDLRRAADMIGEVYPAARIMVIEAYRGPAAPTIPTEIDLWGFNAYAIPDPGAEPLYTDHLDRAASRLAPHQSLVLIMDANYTPYHREAGLEPADMAQVAQNYLALARSRSDVAMLLGYTWAGGIDSTDERGVRDLPGIVRRAHETIGRSIVEG
ncbi:MAG: hypothetical protein ACK5LS_04110 [Propioniciclava sp.]